jgi:hypothetical protein
MPRRQLSGFTRFTALLLGCASIASAAGRLEAQDAITHSIGGTGGLPYGIGCGTSALVGVEGRSTLPLLLGYTVVGAIQALCVRVDADGSWIGSPSLAPGLAGVNSGTFAKLQCPAGQAVSAISGKGESGNYPHYVYGLVISCSPLGGSGRLSGASTAISPHLGLSYEDLGMTGTEGPYACPDNKPGKGLTGRAKDWVDQVALVCNYPVVAHAAVKAISLAPSSVTGASGTLGKGVVTLEANAPSGGTQVTLSASPSGSVVFGQNPVTVLAGNQSAAFVVTPNAVAAATDVTITASPRTGLPTATLTVLPPVLEALSLSASQTSVGGSLTGTTALTGKAFTGGLSMTLKGSRATVPATLTVPQGQNSVSFPVTANSPGCAVVTATYNAISKSAKALVIPAGNSKFALKKPIGTLATVAVVFPTAAPARTVTLASDNTFLATVPSSVEVPDKASTATFTISLINSRASGCFVITVTDPSGNRNYVVGSVEGGVLKAVATS